MTTLTEQMTAAYKAADEGWVEHDGRYAAAWLAEDEGPPKTEAWFQVRQMWPPKTVTRVYPDGTIRTLAR